MFKRILKEPLIHFLVIGSLLFLVANPREDVPAAPAASHPPVDRAINVDAAKLASLLEMWETYWRRPPTEEEFEKLVDDFVLEEVLCREAVALELDEGDPVIRNRLREQMVLLAEDVGELPEPDEETLRAYMDGNIEDYLVSGHVSFRQIYFGVADSAEAQRAARDALSMLTVPEPETDWEDLGTEFWLPATLDTLDLKEIAQLLGENFRDVAVKAEPGAWVGPVESKYGCHLVCVLSRTGGVTPSFEEKRETVRRDWQDNERQKRMDAFFADIRAKYQVSVAEFSIGDEGGERGVGESGDGR